MKTIRVLKPGPLSTVQDGGRYGYQDRGVPVSGAMDLWALRLGNLLVGNPEYEASVEITLGGFEAVFLKETRFALTGLSQGVRINGQPVPAWKCLSARGGDVLTLDYARNGVRYYLSLAGGVEVPLVMGSKSTYLRGGFGGFLGRPLGKRDEIQCGRQGGKFLPGVPPDLIPAYSREPTVRVLLGPQEDGITEEGISRFLTGPFELTQRSDRMGCLLSGPRISHKKGPDIISDGTAFGSIQVPGNGQPIILMADRQTIGGYVKVATVASFDLPLVAQCLPGTRIRFEAVTLERARKIFLEKEKRLKDFFRENI